ncbi:MAG: hypothetical protein A2Y67_00950 [Candidatus Buchananbacteria bacterium RBG_13_39_9]|uniref:PARP-type domain-containing protein n=1 Tax=Candidatus Buchananbacteria bacterium RBG_13_39_9 TaxID=1797531 RepID=A0A1G1XNJ2_9BACT|nr:MAG: hypothetical protein A2Y67_00950 [Candidatus Buchananbacteria bacterium RBG_13_39_9]
MKKILLRTYSYCEQKYHGTCVLCELPICAGDPYIAKVWIIGRKLWVEKAHWGCPVNPDDDQKENQLTLREKWLYAA